MKDVLDIAHGVKLLLSHWRWWLLPALLALALAIYFQDPFAGEWDSLDYAVYALNSWFPSSMALGRMLFIFSNRAAYLLAHSLFGLQAPDAYLLFKYMVIAETPFAIVAMWALARELSGSSRTATLAALMLALSPFFIFLSGQAMTEIPSILIMCSALTIHLRGLRKRNTSLVILGAALLGLGVNVREGVGLFGVWLALGPLACGWKLRSRDLALTAAACAVFVLCALGPFAVWFGLNLGGYRDHWFGWLESARREAVLYPIELRNVRILFELFFITSPIALLLSPFALWTEWRERKLSPLLLIGAIGLLANLLLVTYYATIIHGRYFLTGLPALIPLVADYAMRTLDQQKLLKRPHGLADWPLCAAVMLVAAGGIFGFLQVWPGQHYMQRRSIELKAYRERLQYIPRDNAVVMSNGMTVAVNYWRGVGAGNWMVIGCGMGWPGNDKLVETVKSHHRQGRRVFVDADPRLWSRHERVTEALPPLERHFRFREITDTIYEI